METTFNLLIISKNENSIRTFENAIAQSKFKMKKVSSCLAATQILNGFLPDLVLCDMALAQFDNGLFFKTIRKKIPQAIVNMLLEQNNKKLIFQAMTYGINNYLIMPMSTYEISKYLKQCEFVLSKRQRKNTQNHVIQSRTMSVKTDNSFSHLPQLIDSLLSEANPCLRDLHSELRIGLEELIINAIEHGNLNISFEEKSTAILNGTFDDLVKQRLSDTRYKNKSVAIQFHQEPEFDEWFIKDEGNGFDPCEISTIVGESELQQIHGRGILISRFQFDEVEYSENGTKVRLRRYVPIYQ